MDDQKNATLSLVTKQKGLEGEGKEGKKYIIQVVVEGKHGSRTFLH
jgi:hypothetical protein